MMTGEELRAVLTKLGLSQLAAGKLLVKNGRTIRRWVQDGINDDPVAAVLLRLLAAGKVTVADVERAKLEEGL